jgi:hypothetical protein
MVKVRVEGLPEEVAAFIQELRDKDMRILLESKEYSDYVRVYLEIE